MDMFFLSVGAALLLSFFLGRLVERLRIPLIFGALLVGTGLAVYNPIPSTTASPEFVFSAQLGMYFLLFLIGFEIDLKEMRKMSGFIVKATAFIILFEALIGTLFIHAVFGTPWIVAFLVSLSFATVGEAILIPILDEFRLTNTPLGQIIIGVGTLDDVIEVATLVGVVGLIGAQSGVAFDWSTTLGSLLLLGFFTVLFLHFSTRLQKIQYTNPEAFFLLVFAGFLVFLGIGEYADSLPIAALLAGFSLQAIIPLAYKKEIENSIRILTYGLFAPFFFLWVGLTLDTQYLFTAPLLILAVTAVSKAGKLIASYLVGRKKLGVHRSILLGIGLSVRFSSSIVVIKILYDNHLIKAELFSILIASSIVFKFVVPVLFSHLVVKWRIARGRA